MAPGSVAAIGRHRRPARRRHLVALVLTTLLLLGAVGWALRTGATTPEPAPVAVAERAKLSSRPTGGGVLRSWDRARAAAYAAGSVTALRQLYADGAGATDVRVLRSYLHRGYRVDGMRMQLLAVSVRKHEPGTWVLRVTDRLAGARAVGHGEPVGLPRDRASTRTVRLERGPDDRWRVVSVRG